MESKKHYNYITGLKGISCILILAGHYLGLYKHAQQFAPRISLLDAVLNSPFSFFLKEGYWLYLFFFISGYLVAKTNIKKPGEIVIKSIRRFFRLAFPVFFAYLLIYILYILIGFHNVSTSALFHCDWFQNYYSEQYSIVHVLRSPIDVLLCGRVVLNGPYWVLRDMFFSSIIIYILKSCYLFLSQKNEAICLSIMVIITVAFVFISPIIASCLIGMLISIYEDVEGILKKPYFAFWAIIISMLQYALSATYIFNVFFIFLILFIPRVKFIDNIFSSSPFRFLGKISWGIYSFHWPLMCSLGSILIIQLQPQIGLLNSYAIACIISSLATFIIAVIFYYTFERLSSYLLANIDICIKRIASQFSVRKII